MARPAAQYTSPVIPTMAIPEREMVAERFYAASRQENVYPRTM